MNERISELGDQAWDYALDHETVNGKAAFGSFINKNFSDLLLEKFAELILQECIDAIDAARPYHTNDHLVNDYMNGVEHGHKFAVTMIRKHFGVEK